MHGKKYDDAKKEIRSVLLTYQESVTLEEFSRTYRSLIGQRLPSRELGYSNDVEFLKSMPDVVDLKYDSHNKIFLNGIADKASQHIQKLVSKQRKSKPNNNKYKQAKTRQPVHNLPRNLPTARELKPFLPGGLRVKILELMDEFDPSSGVTCSSLALSYFKKYKKVLPLPNGLNSLESMIKLIPELEVVKIGSEATIYHKKYLKDMERDYGSCKKTETSALSASNSAVKEKSSTSLHESGVPDDILKDFQLVLQKYPDGIQNIHFPTLYEKITGKTLDIVELGYKSMTALVEALPHIFTRVSNSGDKQCWLIYPSESHDEQSFKAKSDLGSKQHLCHHREVIPANVSSPTLQYIQSTIPDYIDLDCYVPVFVSAIANPSLFWFQLQTDEFIENIEKLEKDMENFYSTVGYEYMMNNADIAIGATCVIQCPDDGHYYRAVIKSIPSPEFINVSFVDYGSRDNVPRNNIYYVWSKLHEYPAYALRANLAGLKPSGNADSWSSQARKRFVELCNCVSLVALIKPIDKDSYSVSLCDVSTDDDIFLHNVLITEGYAEICPQRTEDNNSSECGKKSDDHNIHADLDSGFTSSQDKSQSENSDITSESEELPVNRKLFPPTVEDNTVHSNAAYFNFDKSSERYVKQVDICEGSKIHLIKLKDKLFMSCDELCGLLWSEKNSNHLIRSLTHKEIDIPFIHIKETDYPELFKQCLWYKVPGFIKKDSENSSLVLYPLEEAFNILNIFGHPSVCLRVIIQHEKNIFNPLDDFWTEFSYENPADLQAIECSILEEINKLCLYDLKAKSEAYKLQRLKLLKMHANPNIEEVQKIENILEVITRKIKQIQAICSQYSNCS